MNGAERIAAERKRQIEEEGFTAKHDSDWKHDDSQLAIAAVCYSLPEDYRVDMNFPEEYWPWDWRFWKPTPKNRIRELEKAGALIAAEIDRLLRLEGK